MLKEIFNRVKRRTQAREGDAFNGYWQNVIARLANSEQLDDEAVVLSAESMGKTLEQVEQDVALYATRKRMADELAQVPRWRSEAARLQATIDQASAELQAHETRLRAIIDTAYRSKQALEAQLDGTIQHETHLAATCPNPGLAQREEQLNNELRQLNGKRQSMLSEISGNEKNTPGWALRWAEQKLDEDKKVRAMYPDSVSRERVEQTQRQVDHYRAEVERYRKAIQDIDEQLQSLNQERAAIRKQKLNP